MHLLYNFQRCLNATYTHTEESGDYAISVNGKKVYLMFQHSSGCADWKNNLDFPAKPYHNMNGIWFCHRGFLRVWKAMKDIIENEVEAIIAKKTYVKEIICIGYSHGAALSLFATEDMFFKYGDKIKVSGYGYGCPRVVFGILPRSVKERFVNFNVIRNIPDLVTHLPPALLLYHHVGNMIEIGERGKYTPIQAHTSQAYIDSLKKYKIYI